MSIKLLLTIIVLFFVVFGSYYIFKPNDCNNFIIDRAHKIDPKKVPLNERKCPNGADAIIVNFIAPNNNVMDAGWRRMIYCEKDKIYWIADQKGMVPPDEYGSMVDYYGPFTGKACK